MPTSFQSVTAITAGKVVAGVTGLLKLGAGTSLPGKIARGIDPGCLTRLCNDIRGPRIAVTGTNGKTTTCGLLAQFLREGGHRVVHNQLGANMVPGITAALVRQTDWAGHLSADMAVFEVDEASMQRLTAETSLQQVVVTNLFRDQLDRYGELDTTARLIADGIRQNRGEGLQLLLNADDPLVTSLRRHLDSSNVVYFGVEEAIYEYDSPMESPVPATREVTACPQCGANLDFDSTLYGHLGHYHCHACGFTRPKPQVAVKTVTVRPEGSRMTVVLGATATQPETALTVDIPLPGLFNVYNVLAAMAAAWQQGISPQALETGLTHYRSVFGRAERKVIQGRPVMVLLIKNPVGASEVLRLVGGDPNGRLLVALNDNYADGRDVSWIWDAQFERLAGSAGGSKPMVVSGTRAHDLALRLKYAGVAAERLAVVPDLRAAVQQAVSGTQPGETLYILPTYTVLLALRQII
ncbi:MAG: MurT ligase domain-containing protein [Candidatus Melainabacteria bacterium]